LVMSIFKIPTHHCLKKKRIDNEASSLENSELETIDNDEVG
jgi:hypothetical protein